MTVDRYEKWLVEKSCGVGIFPVTGYAPRKGNC